MLKGELISNGSNLNFSAIGIEEDALLCVTPLKNCCKANRRGEFYNIRNGIAFRLPRRGDNKVLYRNRGPSVVRLNRRNSGAGVGSIAGDYLCCLPNGCGEEECIKITLV